MWRGAGDRAFAGSPVADRIQQICMTQPQPSAVRLTSAQQAVVDHDAGPALVFAVAGAGKTTAMVHRIERLVRQRLFPASQILATSFGKGNEQDLRQKLAPWPHCRAVRVRTLHALGRSIIVRAQQAGHWSHVRLSPDAGESYDLDQRLLTIAIQQARLRAEPYAPELEAVDRQDFLSYVAACKGNLRYADLQRADLPSPALRVAGEAEAPGAALDWYLDLYRLFEAVRLQQGVVTFADMLLMGWEALVRYPSVLEVMQAEIQCVLVDEFQDVNRAQAQILDLLTAPNRNYMVIGDDDQTIYEWRGANPRFILEFERRYKARKYVIDDNFRSPAGPLVLANRLVAHNRQRAPKRLQLTRGFKGETRVRLQADAATMASAIVDKIQTLQDEGWRWRDMAVLVRLNAHTPYIEQGLIGAEIPFLVSNPFYSRYEIRTLVYYVRLAWVEWALQTGKELSAAQRRWFTEAWQAVYNRPKRYLSRQLHDSVVETVLKRGASPTEALRRVLPQAPHDGVAANLEFLADDLAWLAVRLRSDAAQTLAELEERLEYKAYLLDSSGFPQTGAGRAASVDALIDYARGKGTVLDFVQHLRRLSRHRTGRRAVAGEDAVTLTTIHGAKGLEWPIVFLAQCNQEIMPFNGQRAENMEEERRLFYVALTRSSHHLYLHAVKSQPLSPFLAETGWRQALPALREVGHILQRNPRSWQAIDAWQLARSVKRYGLNRYFEHWWDAAPARREAVARKMRDFLAAVAAQNAWHALGLRASDAAFWIDLAPQCDADPEPAFPGMGALLAERTRQA